MLRLVPHVTALSTQYLTSHCSGCHEEQQPNRPLLRCQRCKIVCYCDQVCYLMSLSDSTCNQPGPTHSLPQLCQKFDWPLHKFECPALVAHAEKRATPSEPKEGDVESAMGTILVPSETIRALGRLLWLHSREKPDGVKVSHVTKSLFLSLTG
jgi:SET and MYND domain-containing protein